METTLPATYGQAHACLFRWWTATRENRPKMLSVNWSAKQSCVTEPAIRQLQMTGAQYAASTMMTELLIDPRCGGMAFWAAPCGMQHVFRKSEFFCESCQRKLTIDELKQMVNTAIYRPKLN